MFKIFVFTSGLKCFINFFFIWFLKLLIKKIFFKLRKNKGTNITLYNSFFVKHIMINIHYILAVLLFNLKNSFFFVFLKIIITFFCIFFLLRDDFISLNGCIYTITFLWYFNLIMFYLNIFIYVTILQNLLRIIFLTEFNLLVY